MKTSRIIPIALALLTGLGACQQKASKNTLVFATDSHNGVVNRTITMKNDSISLNIDYSGTVAFTEDETAISSLTPNDHLRYKMNSDELQANADAKGTIAYILKRGGKSLNPQDAEGKAFIAEAIRVMHDYGLDLDQRLGLLYRHSGSTGVLAEADRLRSGDLKKTAIDYVLTRDTLSAVLPAAARSIATVDDQLAKKDLLLKWGPRFLNDAAAQPAYFDAVKSESSAQLRGMVITGLADKGNWTEAQWIALLNAAAAIEANAEKTNTLLHVIQKAPHTAAVTDAARKAVATISATPERQQVEKAIQ